MANPGGGDGDPAPLGGGDDPAPADPAYAAELRSALEAHLSAAEGENSPRTRTKRRLEALNGWTGVDEPPFDRQPMLCAAHHLGDSTFVGILLEAGADVASAFGPRCHPVALAIHHGQVDAVRFLMRSGRHHANERLPYCWDSVAPPSYPPGVGWAAPWHEGAHWCLPLHMAAQPPPWQPPRTAVDPYLPPPRPPPICPPPQPEVMEVLLREFKADANGRDYYGRTPLHLLAEHSTAPPADAERALDVLLKFGADIEACDHNHMTPLYAAVSSNPAFVPILLSRGASANVVSGGVSPLSGACGAGGPRARDNVPLLLAASSQETRRAVCVTRVPRYNDSDDSDDSDDDSDAGSIDAEWSALDFLLGNSDRPCDPDEPWVRDVVDQLLLSGVPVHPMHVDLVLPYAARLGVRLPARLVARGPGPPTWRLHDAMVSLALGFEERRALDEGVRRREARVAELERQLDELGIDSSSGEEEEESDDSSSSSGEEDESGSENDDDKKEDESGPGGG